MTIVNGKWVQPDCPVLPSFPFKLECSEGQAWKLRVDFPGCIRLKGGGYCPSCMCEVIPVRVLADPEAGKRPDLPKVEGKPMRVPTAAKTPPSADTRDGEAPRWRPK